MRTKKFRKSKQRSKRKPIKSTGRKSRKMTTHKRRYRKSKSYKSRKQVKRRRIPKLLYGGAQRFLDKVDSERAAQEQADGGAQSQSPRASLFGADQSPPPRAPLFGAAATRAPRSRSELIMRTMDGAKARERARARAAAKGGTEPDMATDPGPTEPDRQLESERQPEPVKTITSADGQRSERGVASLAGQSSMKARGMTPTMESTPLTATSSDGPDSELKGMFRKLAYRPSSAEADTEDPESPVQLSFGPRRAPARPPPPAAALTRVSSGKKKWEQEEALRAALVKAECPVSEAGVRVLHAAGLGVRDLLDMDEAAARRLGLSAEDAQLVGAFAARAPLQSSMAGTDEETQVSHQEKYRMALVAKEHEESQPEVKRRRQEKEEAVLAQRRIEEAARKAAKKKKEDEERARKAAEEEERVRQEEERARKAAEEERLRRERQAKLRRQKELERRKRVEALNKAYSESKGGEIPKGPALRTLMNETNLTKDEITEEFAKRKARDDMLKVASEHARADGAWDEAEELAEKVSPAYLRYVQDMRNHATRLDDGRDLREKKVRAEEEIRSRHERQYTTHKFDSSAMTLKDSLRRAEQDVAMEDRQTRKTRERAYRAAMQAAPASRRASSPRHRARTPRLPRPQTENLTRVDPAVLKQFNFPVRWGNPPTKQKPGTVAIHYTDNDQASKTISGSPTLSEWVRHHEAEDKTVARLSSRRVQEREARR